MSRRLKVLCLVTEAYGGRGGIAQACRDVIDAMAAGDRVVQIDIVPRNAPDLPKEMPQKARQHRPCSNRIAYAISAIGAARNRPDIVFCNHLFMAPLAAIIAQSLGATLIIQLHGIEIWQTPSFLRRLALEAADFVWCVSRDTRARALTHADITPERAIVLNNCVGLEFRPGDRAGARSRLGLSTETVLLSVGRLDPRELYKGNDRVIEALANLSADGQEIVYLVAGEGDDRSRLERIARERKVEGHVRFLGRVSAADLPDLYRAADLFALPSTGEGFGIVFLEAMACGTPAIGLAAGGATDALAEGALGVCATEAEFPLALARAIKAPRPDPASLSAATHARFGRAAFQRNVARAIEMVQ